METIKLSIQEVINDFEIIIREHERIMCKYELDRYDSNQDENDFKHEMKTMCNKYIPNYKNFTHKSIENEGEMLFNMLYKNFKEILYELV